MVFYSIENPNRDFLFHSANYTPSTPHRVFTVRINLFRFITLGKPRGKRDGPTPGTEAFPDIGPRNGQSHKRHFVVVCLQHSTGQNGKPTLAASLTWQEYSLHR
jgi:hypothetical protein